MKLVIRLILFFLPLLVFSSCNEDTLDVPTPLDSYDIREPGLGEENFGQVKWIFKLQKGQTKILAIDGKNYTITLSKVENNVFVSYSCWWNNAFNANLDVNGAKVDVITFRVFYCKPEEDMTALCNENILSVHAGLKSLFANPNEVAQSFEGYFGYGSLIDDHIMIYIGACYCRLSPNLDDTPIEDANLSFIIIKHYPK